MSLKKFITINNKDASTYILLLLIILISVSNIVSYGSGWNKFNSLRGPISRLNDSFLAIYSCSFYYTLNSTVCICEINNRLNNTCEEGQSKIIRYRLFLDKIRFIVKVVCDALEQFLRKFCLLMLYERSSISVESISAFWSKYDGDISFSFTCFVIYWIPFL